LSDETLDESDAHIQHVQAPASSTEAFSTVAGSEVSQHRAAGPFAVPASLAVPVTLVGCGAGGGGSPRPPTGTGNGLPPSASPPPASSPSDPAVSFALDPADMAAARFLLQAQVGATGSEIAAVKSSGFAAYLDGQFAVPLGPKAWDWLVAQGYTAIDERQYVFSDYQTEFSIVYQLVTGRDSVRKRVALALSEFFVVSAIGIEQLPWRGQALAHYWDTLNEHAFGNFRALLEVVSLHPAMGQMLNTRGNRKADPATGRVPDENYAREVMQLFTIGLVQLNPDGTPQRDAGGKPIPTYDQDDVTQLARAFTGYDIYWDGTTFTSGNSGPTPYPEFTRRPMTIRVNDHEFGEVRFLGATVPAELAPAEQVSRVHDILFNHPNVGPFFARQMIQRLVTSDPSPAYVARVAAAFNNNGAGVRGDLKAVWRAVLLDDEARGSAGLTSTTFGKVREPMIRTYQWARSFRAKSLRGTWKWAHDMENPTVWYGQRPFFSPSVFNFFRPGYVPPGTSMAAAGATAPEFQIVNESTVSQWANFCEGLSIDGLWVVQPERPGFPFPYAGPYPNDGHDIVPDYRPEIAIAHDFPALMRRLNLLLCAGQLSVATQQKIVQILSEGPVVDTSSPENVKRNRVAAAITLVMCCPEYLVQK
jgi:uncharacterized protein (DUF1800 family)